MAPQQRRSDGDGDGKSAWWWPNSNASDEDTRGVTANEIELVNAAVLCAALSAVKADTTSSDKLAVGRAARELELHVRQSPLPYTLQFPAMAFTRDYVLMESEGAVICAVRATKPKDIVRAVAGSAVPLSQPYVHRFGGARVHAPFWKRAQRLDLQEIHHQAHESGKTLLLCGHSIGGSIAQLAFCELLLQRLPKKMRALLEREDAERPKADKKEHRKEKLHLKKDRKDEFAAWMRKAGDPDREAALRSLPAAIVVGFGAPYVGNEALSNFLEPLGMHKRVVTFVNEFDCIPGILNIAHSAATVANTTERLVTIARATRTLLNLLPDPMQQKLLQMTANVGSAVVPNASSAYLSMSITMLKRSFDKLRDFNIVKAPDYQYAPCGIYVFLTKENADFKVHADQHEIRKALGEEDEDTGLTGNSILQHRMSAYVDAVVRRSKKIQINSTMNYYERLGISRDASEREIKTSYRSLALKWHPDRWTSGSLDDKQKESAEEVFKLLAQSYEVLSNPTARKAYDTQLNEAPSRKEEFMHYGTVDGVSLDEAINTFSDVIDNFSGAMDRVTNHISSSSSTSVGHPLQHNAGKTSAATTSNSVSGNTTGTVSAPTSSSTASASSASAPASSSSTSASTASSTAAPASSTSTSTSTSSAGTSTPSTGASTSLSKTADLITSNNAASPSQSTQTAQTTVNTRPSSDSTSSTASSGSTLKTISVVGGAVAIAVSVAVIVSAWSQFSDSSRKKRQAAAVRDMPGDCLVLLLEDQKRVQQRQSRTPSIQLLQQSKERHTKALAIASAGAVDGKEGGESTTKELSLAKETKQALAMMKQQELEQDDELIEEFFECASRDEDAAAEAMVEQEFFECVELVQDMDQHFSKRHERLRHPRGSSKIMVSFPKGSTVNTPFGLGVVEDWRENTSSAAIRFESSETPLRYINKMEIGRGASKALEEASTVAEEKRAELAERVIVSYRLGDRKNTGDQLKTVAIAGVDGAADSTVRAVGGMALAKGVTATGTSLGGMVAAPLTVASILVDIGKEFYDYRKKHTERKSLGVLSTTSERLMRRDFRLKTGEVVVSRTTAAAGAGLGAYGMASAMALWAAAGVATGPIGIVAATSAAVVGGVAGFFGGSKVYSLSTAKYFKSQKHATEHIDRLELGARILFEEYDPTGTGEISKDACLTIMNKLYALSGDDADGAYEATIEAIQDPSFEGPVTWRMFWIWVSTEAARSLHNLDRKEEGSRKRDKVRKLLSEAKRKHQQKSERKHQQKSERKHLEKSEHKHLSAAESDAVVSESRSSVGEEEEALEKAEEIERAIHARSTFTSVLPGEDDSLEDVRAMVETLVHSHHLTTGQAFKLYAQLDSDDPAEWVAAREIVLTLNAHLLEYEPESEQDLEYEELFPVAKSESEATPQEFEYEELFPVAEAPRSEEPESKTLVPEVLPVNVKNELQVVPSSSSKMAKPPKSQGKKSSSKSLKRWNSKTRPVDPRLDVMCSLLSAEGLQRFLQRQDIVPEEGSATRHEDLHCLALASAVPPASSSNYSRKMSKGLK